MMDKIKLYREGQAYPDDSGDYYLQNAFDDEDNNYIIEYYILDSYNPEDDNEDMACNWDEVDAILDCQTGRYPNINLFELVKKS